MDLLITKKITGRKLNAREAEILSTWLEASDQNKKIFLQMKVIYSQEQPESLKGYKDSIWQELQDASAVTNRKTISAYQALRWAAIFLITSSLMWVLNDQFFTVDNVEVIAVNYIEKVSLYGQKITTVLPDGTEVKLNSGSKITVPEVFTDDERRVKLEGEAFFDVTRNEQKPFIIETNDFEVRVLGTSFNISAYDDGQSGQVAVKTGKVLVESLTGKDVELNPNEMVEVTAGQLTNVDGFDPQMAFGWLDQKLVFKDNTINEIFTKLEKWYNVEIEANKMNYNDELFTGAFQNPALGEVMLSLSKVFKFDYEMNDKNVTIRSK